MAQIRQRRPISDEYKLTYVSVARLCIELKSKNSARVMITLNNTNEIIQKRIVHKSNIQLIQGGWKAGKTIQG